MNFDDDFEEVPEYRGISATIILINVFDPAASKAYKRAHNATCQLMRQYLRESNSKLLGVCLYGVEVTDASMLGAKNIRDIFPLETVTLDKYTMLKDEDLEQIKQEKELTMSDALLHCSKMFSNCKKLLSSRTIIILSKLDIPPIKDDQKPTLKRIVDLVDSYIDVKMINLLDTNTDPFYYNFLVEANKGKDVDIPKAIYDEKEIEKMMYQQSDRHLSVARLTFEMGNGFNIGVGVYNLLKSNTYLKSSNLNSETNEVLTTVTKTMKVSMEVDGEDQEEKQVPLLKSEILYYQNYGGERIEFTDSELKRLKNPFGPPMLKLLGFKPKTQICKEKWYLKKGYFLFPNEGIIEGSILPFKALHQACIETGVVALCVLCTRVNSRPFNVALSPCTNPLGLDVDIGFDVICIPFIENIRDIPMNEEEDIEDVTDVHKKVMKDTLNVLKFDYKPDMFENPKLQSLHNAIEAIVLQEEDIDQFKDTTKPNMNAFADLDDEAFLEVFGPFGVGPVKRTAAVKSESAKRVKTEITEIDESLLESRLANNEVKKYTVEQLKEILRSKDIPELPALTGMKKANLIDLVIKNFS